MSVVFAPVFPFAVVDAHRAPLPAAVVLRRTGVALVAAGLLLLIVFQFTDLDLRLADAAWDATARRFPAKGEWFAATFMHRWVKLALVAGGTLTVAAALVDLVRPWRRLDAVGHWRLRLSAAGVVLVPLAIGLWKARSALHCPWDVDRYGGAAPYLRLLDGVPAGWSNGACFPAGHASSALWLAAFCVWWLPQAPRKAAAVFAAGLAAGFVLGWVQQLRGAHFLSHTLWSVWTAAAVLWALFALLRWRLVPR
jgi:membrane-associated PAP2 superfamily phosphatase